MQLFLGFLAGLVLLLLGAEFLVRGASRLALALGLTPIVVGLTVVAIGTSTPELAVSLGGAFSGSTGIAVGNAVGSNIANVLLILGLVALVSPLVVHRQLVWIDVPIMIAACLLCFAMAADGQIARWEGIGLVRLSLEALDDRSRELVRLKFNENLSYKEISARTGLKSGHVGYLLHHALKRIADELAKNGMIS